MNNSTKHQKRLASIDRAFIRFIMHISNPTKDLNITRTFK